MLGWSAAFFRLFCCCCSHSIFEKIELFWARLISLQVDSMSLRISTRFSCRILTDSLQIFVVLQTLCLISKYRILAENFAETFKNYCMIFTESQSLNRIAESFHCRFSLNTKGIAYQDFSMLFPNMSFFPKSFINDNICNGFEWSLHWITKDFLA